MTCAEVQRWLDDDSPRETPEVTAHLASCASCRRAVERWRAMRDELRAMGEDPAPPFLHSRVMAHVRAAGAASRARRPAWLRPVFLAPAAAVLFVAAVIGVTLHREPWHPTPAALPETTRPPASELKPPLEPAPRSARPRPAMAPPRASRDREVPSDHLTRKAEAPVETRETEAPPSNVAEMRDEGAQKGAAAGVAERRLGFAPEPPALPPPAPAAPVVRPQAGSAAPAREERAREARAPRQQREELDAELSTRRSVPTAAAASSAPAGEAFGGEAGLDVTRHQDRSPTRCLVVSLDHATEEARTVLLAAGLSPDPHVAWIVTVADDGRISVALASTDKGTEKPAASGQLSENKPQVRAKAISKARRAEPAAAALRALHALDLPPGRYLVRRAD